jgi:hypothetical protein
MKDIIIIFLKKNYVVVAKCLRNYPEHVALCLFQILQYFC